MYTVTKSLIAIYSHINTGKKTVAVALTVTVEFNYYNLFVF